MNHFATDRPVGMARRHFLRHLTTSTMTIPALQFACSLRAHAREVINNQKACILLWLGGGPPTIDMWDLKPGSKYAGEFRPIGSTGQLQICEHLPQTARQMKHLSVVRSMSTREADHSRGRYYLHTAFVPIPTVVHPAFGSVVSLELGSQRKELQIPAFVSVGSSSAEPGFLGMAHAAFVVESNGEIRNKPPRELSARQLSTRLRMLELVETNFIKSQRGESPQSHAEVYKKAVNLMTSKQMLAFRVDQEQPQVIKAYGANNFGRGCLMARRLVEVGVPFVEVNMGGWDLHQNVFDSLTGRLLPRLDRGLAALTADLKQRGMLEHTVIVCMGEFGRTPRINQNVGRDHWAASWSVLIGGGGLVGGQAIGKTDKDGVEIMGNSYLPGDIWATVAQALGISLQTVYTSKRGRPMKIANGGTPIAQLFG